MTKKPMKIGIVTFHRAHNYGAVLQAYAMKRLLSPYGTAELIDYSPPYLQRGYALINWPFLTPRQSGEQLTTDVRAFVSTMMLLPFRLPRHMQFKRFINKRLLDRQAGSRVILARDFPEHYDVYVFGSDQIWRAMEHETQPYPDIAYLGSGQIGKKKVAIAASMGKIDTEVLGSQHVCSLLEDFDAIGVREKSLQIALQSVCKLPAEHVLDPTLLLPAGEWVKFSKIRRSAPSKPYLLLYNLHSSGAARGIAKSICDVLGLRLIETNGYETLRGVISPSIRQSASPERFVRLVYGANFVVSTSFHGVVFALIFRKSFVACGMGEHSSRVADLLSNLGLENRLIDDDSSFSDVDMETAVDYARIGPTLDILIRKSVEFIDRSLKTVSSG
ncbi:MAG: polysaccharide pyruvyl transferase family protein [Pseudomonadota bacterium]